ncbi:unnamed protein product [Musa acuminata subsp. malaccensis]|uniref:(wild Malaysian banana) hypothetical protein n=1 Tax=Musa acuminata subsp. malaccensis TaxID=214687 RepID=A0A8D6ZN03_MUSAM|nr:unnamed protein product [Musa acuminata subsp. malaccensis]
MARALIQVFSMKQPAMRCHGRLIFTHGTRRRTRAMEEERVRGSNRRRGCIRSRRRSFRSRPVQCPSFDPHRQLLVSSFGERPSPRGRLVGSRRARPGQALHQRHELAGLSVDHLGRHRVDDDRLPLVLLYPARLLVDHRRRCRPLDARFHGLKPTAGRF